jgi:hypothetical protein
MGANVALGSSCCPTSSITASSFRTNSRRGRNEKGAEICRAYFQLRPGSSSFRQRSIISLNSNVQRGTSTLASDGSSGLNRSTGGLEKSWRLVPRATVAEGQQPEQASPATSLTLKDLLEDLKPLGRVRLSRKGLNLQFGVLAKCSAKNVCLLL